MNWTRPIVKVAFLLLGVGLAEVGMADGCNVRNWFDRTGWRVYFIQLVEAPDALGPDDGQWPQELMIGLANSAEEVRTSYPLHRFDRVGDDVMEGERIAKLVPIELP